MVVNSVPGSANDLSASSPVSSGINSVPEKS